VSWDQSLRTGGRVFLTADPAVKGTISRIRDGQFRVSYDSERTDGGKRLPGGRYSYPLHQLLAFTPGNPPPVVTE
jgi:hypothetical protein